MLHGREGSEEMGRSEYRKQHLWHLYLLITAQIGLIPHFPGFLLTEILIFVH